jgi:hypothetical protein
MTYRTVGFFALFLFVVLFGPLVAFAQEAAAPAEPSWLPLVITLLSAVAGSSFLSTFLKSGSWWMKIIDAVALNWGKARNDPKVQ